MLAINIDIIMAKRKLSLLDINIDIIMAKRKLQKNKKKKRKRKTVKKTVKKTGIDKPNKTNLKLHDMQMLMQEIKGRLMPTTYDERLQRNIVADDTRAKAEAAKDDSTRNRSAN